MEDAPELTLPVRESAPAEFAALYGNREEWVRRAGLYERLLGSALVRDPEARAAEERALEALAALLRELDEANDGVPVGELFGDRERPERGAFVWAVLRHIGRLQEVTSGQPSGPDLSAESWTWLSDRGYGVGSWEEALRPFFGLVFAVHGRLALPVEDRLPFVRAVAAGVLGVERWGVSLLTLVRAASSAGYELPGLGDPLVLEAAEFYDRAGEALVPAEGLSPEWERALVPPHRQLVDPVPGYFAVDRVEHLDDEGRLRVSGFFNGPDVSVRGFYDVLPRVTEVVFWSRDGRGSLVGVFRRT